MEINSLKFFTLMKIVDREKENEKNDLVGCLKKIIVYEYFYN